MTAPPQFIDLSRHLSPETLARKVNPLKDIIRVVTNNPQLISLANGDPHHSLYPIRRIDYEVASAASDDPVGQWKALGSSAATQVLSTSKDDESRRLLNSALAYGHGAGLSDALRIVTEINNKYHTAPHHVPTMTLGNADAITKCLRMLATPGDSFLADEFTFAPMPMAAEAHGVNWVPVRIDSGGLVPEELERILANWNPERGRRPHVLYTTPCGQNPTGSTLSLERRKQIYDIAQRYDIIIIEDDPYYFLQYDAPGSEPAHMTKDFATSLLSMDVDGRVIRIDSFSKIMAPGMRLGWITSHPDFYTHLVKFIDLSTQNPHGFGQILIVELLGPHGWQLAGFDRWVRSLCADYQRRRDFLLALFERDVASTGFASADVPEAGMFIWVRVDVEKHPRFVRAAEDKTGAGVAKTNTGALMTELFDACIASGLVICPSSVFILPADPRYDDVSEPIDDRSNFIRVTFAGAEETMAAGIPILGRVLKEFFAGSSLAK
ncbi:L-tyrosine:2-oxoglutarate aminotransferase [Trametes versicolor FP-101664 SS1]|uniref:L-tyrosine:2-oxoglutarate aminotransferase n=1 Tax=Trametes versicolor (strain FP-101664) TaxID=717944 RepID=UPI0004622943|nr:L-tyrosine:2-oxoglutarate aminotransferase [Trametes versicolor FP-101664 SS1]EIW53725.1 L-tyrosine:2-oxoglutarate aminotransferase [Trametes versicolor FP-101664 SS1]